MTKIPPDLLGVSVRQFMERIGADTLHFLYYYDHMAQLQAFSLALPLGELSPKVTERALQALLNDDIDLCAHAAEDALLINLYRMFPSQSAAPTALPKGEPRFARNALYQTMDRSALLFVRNL